MRLLDGWKRRVILVRVQELVNNNSCKRRTSCAQSLRIRVTRNKISVREIYEEYHLDRFTTYQAIVALFVMFVVARSVAYLLLRRRMKQKERELMKYQDAAPTAEEESKEDVAVAAGAKV